MPFQYSTLQIEHLQALHASVQFYFDFLLNLYVEDVFFLSMLEALQTQGVKEGETLLVDIGDLLPYLSGFLEFMETPLQQGSAGLDEALRSQLQCQLLTLDCKIKAVDSAMRKVMVMGDYIGYRHYFAYSGQYKERVALPMVSQAQPSSAQHLFSSLQSIYMVFFDFMCSFFFVEKGAQFWQEDFTPAMYMEVGDAMKGYEDSNMERIKEEGYILDKIAYEDDAVSSIVIANDLLLWDKFKGRGALDYVKDKPHG